ncbi:Hint domain-containing protein [Planktotalea sp.]|uniref:Hint domain-containing protein n=1 Tax=Planktotalea sp. TaxID=2029877 RepID=UPI003D6A50FD
MNASGNSGNELAQSVPVYRAEDFLVIDGANIDDTLSFASEALLDDVYELNAFAKRCRLSILAQTGGNYLISESSQIGKPGARVVVDSCMTVMTPVGSTLELLLLVELDNDDHVANVLVLPLAPLTPNDPYRLVGIERENATRKLAQVACVSFSRGTNITMSSGAQKPIEDLKVGDKVLTRDDGGQEIRWIGQHTVRAVGDFAPIAIKAGTLNNTNDLLVSPDHRLFIYQRRDALGAGRSEVLVKARHLVNGDTVTQQDGGFVDYFQLLFDQHEIIYAEGIAAETLLVDTRTRPALTDTVSTDVLETLNGHSGWLHQEFEVGSELLGPDAADKLRKASKR